MRNQDKFKEHQRLRKRAKELQTQGYKHSGIWNKLHLEFPQWKPKTILEICHKSGAYRNE